MSLKESVTNIPTGETFVKYIQENQNGRFVEDEQGSVDFLYAFIKIFATSLAQEVYLCKYSVSSLVKYLNKTLFPSVTWSHPGVQHG